MPTTDNQLSRRVFHCPLAVSPPSPPPCKDMRSLFQKDTEERFGERKTRSLNSDVDILPTSGMSKDMNWSRCLTTRIFAPGERRHFCAVLRISKKDHNAVSNLYDPWAVGQSAIQGPKNAIFEGHRSCVYVAYVVSAAVSKDSVIYLPVCLNDNRLTIIFNNIIKLVVRLRIKLRS